MGSENPGAIRGSKAFGEETRGPTEIHIWELQLSIGKGNFYVKDLKLGVNITRLVDLPQGVSIKLEVWCWMV